MVGLPETPSPLDGTLWLRLCHPDDVERVRDAFSGILAGHTDTYEIEFRLMHRDGHAVPVLSRGFVLRAADGTALRVSGVNTDLTVRNQLSEAQSARLAAEAANRAKSEFLSRMSHELRTPLNAILGFAQLLAHDRIDRISERQRSQIRHIEKGGWHLLNMVNEILDLARIESGHAQAKVEVVEVPALLRECTGLLRATADARSIRLECRPELAAVAVAGDRTLVQQVLLNLMGNAIKYTQPGGRVSVSSQRTEHDCVKILVTDNGPGLSEAQQAQLFQPFNRLGHENGTTPGTGIGLVISQRLAELMHGSLSVQSAPGQGSTFAVTLPAHPLEAGEQVALLDQAKTEAAASQQPGRVLYIEDDSANAELMQGFVEQRPLVDLEVQRNAEGGLAAAMRRQPDLILLDMQLPDLPGLDVLRRLRLHPTTAAVPVVVISASAMADSVAAATAAGALDYLAKPLRLETLLATLDRCLPAARLP
jgi:signal transduction histidine kinase/CheY-like chemotaxis protein